MRAIKTVGFAVYVGVIAAALAASVEFATVHSIDPRAFPTHDLLSYLLVYSVLGVLIGAAAGILAITVLSYPRAGLRPRSLAGSMSASTVLFASVGAPLNIYLLPSFLSPISLAFDAALLVAAATLAFWVARSASRREEAQTASPWWRAPIGVATILCLIIVVLAATAPEVTETTPVSSQETPPRNLNILLLVVDALRPDHLGCYGYDRATSPNLDRIASEGIVFTHAYAQAPYTKASTATIVTSLYPSTHGVHALVSGLPDAAPVLMEELKTIGYRTAVLSANAFVSPAFGFARGADFAFSGEVCVTRKSMLGMTLRQIHQSTGMAPWIPRALDVLSQVLPRSTAEISPYEEVSGQLNEILLKWVDNEPARPFFAYVHYMEPHMPLAPPPPYDTMFDERPAAPREVVFPQQPPDIAPFASAPALPSSEHVRLLAQYDATIAYFDAELGNLLDQLAARGKIENTLVILTADHGEEFYEHGRWGHGLAVYEESIHVPMVVWCPPLVRAGRRIDGPVRLVDLTPTILDAAGAPIQPSHDLFEGISLWNALTDEGRRLPDLPVFAELSSGGKSTRTLRADNMKVIYACSEDEERVMLFDLRADPVERLDLARSRPVECAELRTCLEAMYDSICARKMDRCEHRIDEATEETLKALGYLN